MYLSPCLGLGGLLAGCASQPVEAVSSFGGASVREVGGVASQAGNVAARSASAGWDTMGQTYNGMGGAMRAPLKDFNVVHTNVPVVLLRAKANPYDFAALNSCDDILNEVAQLDLALGPDVDNPVIKSHRDRYTSGAEMASGAALDAAKGALDHFIPVRGTIRKLSGAEREEQKQHKAELAGSVRRGFLKSYGMQHNCAWPAAPMGFEPGPGGPHWANAIQANAIQARATVAPTVGAAKSPSTSSVPMHVASNGAATSAPPAQRVSLATSTPSDRTPPDRTSPTYQAPNLTPAATGAWAIGRNATPPAAVNP